MAKRAFLVGINRYQIAGADLTPFVALLGAGAGVQGPVPVQARLTLGQEGEARLLTVRPGLTPARDTKDHEFGIDSMQILWAEAPLLKCAGNKILDEDPAGRDQPLEGGPTRRGPTRPPPSAVSSRRPPARASRQAPGAR